MAMQAETTAQNASSPNMITYGNGRVAIALLMLPNSMGVFASRSAGEDLELYVSQPGA
ncbi:MAG: hypothetical protein JWN13_2489 [Betaproteobacteria bacterium]|jgi:hypothetical protein|nr:hypothetical protein [Betaproteobacteria bacterium]MEA3156398.1 hypothetical protein [Betaproteobacteria bacterium]